MARLGFKSRLSGSRVLAVIYDPWDTHFGLSTVSPMEGICFLCHILLLPFWESFGKRFGKALLWARPPDLTCEDTKARVLLRVRGCVHLGRLSSLSQLACWPRVFSSGNVTGQIGGFSGVRLPVGRARELLG